MALPIVPSPFPTLRPGLSLGAPEHQGFVNAWNWMAGVLKKAKDFFVLALNGRHGEMSIVGGAGIQVVTSGSTITINAGDGEDENYGGGYGGYGGYGGGSGGYPAPSPTPSPSAGSQFKPHYTPSPGPVLGGGSNDDDGGGCNGWSDDPGNADGDDGVMNPGDSCGELNGW